MFWKKKNGDKKLSPKEILMSQIEQLSDGKNLTFRLPEIYWNGLGGFVIIETNAKYGDKGQKKYISFTDMIKEGQPTGHRRSLWNFDSTKEMAVWLIERSAELINQKA